MPSFVVLTGADVEMAEGNGISARIDLNLHLAPPVAADFLRLGPGMENDEEPRQPPPRQGPQDRGIQRRILPRFGPGIHGVFLDLHPEGDPEARIRPAVELSMRPPIRHNRFRRFTSSPSLVSLPSVDGPQRSRRLFQESPRVGGIDHPSKDKAPAKEAEEEEEEEDGGAAKGRGGLVKGGGGDNFECNVCLDMAVEPVVTVCGHLFCWSCLHQWLYVHSDNEECPVCKGSVGEGSIIPIYGRGSSSNSIRQRQFWQEEGRVLPPRPQARRVDGFRRSLTAEAAVAASAAAAAEEELDSELSEMFRVSRMVRLLHGNMSTTFRRRMAERREHYRMPAVPATSTNATAAAAAPPPPGEFDTRAATFQEEYVRQLSASRVDTEERVNAIRARLASLVETIESHRRQAASMAARLQESAGEIGGAVAAAAASWPLPEPVAATAETVERAGSVSSGPRSREREEGSSSGSGDTDSEVLHSRKRRRLN